MHTCHVLKNIKRWNLMRNTREENVQEHSHSVVVTAHALCLIRNRILGGNIDEKTGAGLCRIP